MDHLKGKVDLLSIGETKVNGLGVLEYESAEEN